ncbi:hypothetical protein XENOCAPTIV_002650, partial [Xenoophorus captivus]
DFLRLQPENPPVSAECQQHCPGSTSANLSATGAIMPKTVKSGVVTKRSTVLVSQDRCLEVKINVTEFVVVEDLSCLDTNAVILKGTTVLTYKPRLVDRPFSGSLAGIEVMLLSNDFQTSHTAATLGLVTKFDNRNVTALMIYPCRCSHVGWAASRRRRCPSSTLSTCRWSCVAAPRLNVLQRIGSTQEGNASFTLSGDYYNREFSDSTNLSASIQIIMKMHPVGVSFRVSLCVSGWEPFIEPWPCFLSWQQQAAGRLHPPRLKIGIRAKQRLDVNITSVLLGEFCVIIKKENFPEQQPAKQQVSGSTQQIYRQPGHTMYLLPTMMLSNLLPCDLNFYIKGTSIKGVMLESFPMCKELLIPPGTQNYVVRMRLYDSNNRLLCLTIRIILRAQGALKILVSSPYWLINKTGLPLIFRQDNSKTDAAGQFEEHELARSLSPLLFCYTDKEQPAMCTMRIGKGIHSDGVPGWCQGFSLDGGSGVRALKVIQHGNKPGLIYNIGKML